MPGRGRRNNQCRLILHCFDFRYPAWGTPPGLASSIVCPMGDCTTQERRDDGKQHLTWGDRTREGNIPKTFDNPPAGGLHHWVPEPAEALAKVKPQHYKG